MDLVKNRDRIQEIIIEKGKIFRKNLAEELNIAPRNLNRDIDRLIDKNIIEKGKDGKEIFYIPKINVPSIVIESEMQETIELEPEVTQTPEQFSKITHKIRITYAQKVYDYIKKKGYEVSNRELRNEFNIPTKKFAQYIKPKMETGELIKRRKGRETWYRLGDMPVDKINQRTKLDMLIEQISELKRFKEVMIFKEYANRTMEAYMRILTYFYKWKDNFNPNRFTICEVQRFTIDDIMNFKKHLTEQKHYSDSAIANVYVALKSYFRYLRKENLILMNFMEDVTIPTVEEKEQPAISMEDFWDMVEAVKNDDQSLTLLLIMLETGARVGEVETICREHINFEEKLLTILSEKKKKNKGRRVPRTFPVSDLTLTYLKRLIEKNNKISEPVYYFVLDERIHAGTAIFLTDRNVNMKNRQIRDWINSLRDKLRTPKMITVHSFRRYLTAILPNNGMREDFLALRIGQLPKKMSKVTVNYMKWTTEYKAECNRQYQQAHPLNQPDIIKKFKAIVEASIECNA